MDGHTLLRMKLIENSLSVKSLAHKLGITEQSYFKKAKGDIGWSSEQMLAVKNILNLNLQEFDEIFFGGNLSFKNKNE